MTAVFSTDPRTGERTATDLHETERAEMTAIGQRVTRASRRIAAEGRRARAILLRRVAEGIDARTPELCEVADRETGLGDARLRGEAQRASNQFRLFADVLDDGGYLETHIDHAAEGLPDVRRMLVPVGPVAVFGASNFPFAFSVLGGDTASALAAGCAVVAKAHPAHPLTSQLSLEILRGAGRIALGETDIVSLVFGFEGGRALIADRAIKAASFTGSLPAARALQRVIDERPDPIPFFAELGSVNPLVILPGACERDTGALAAGLTASFTGSMGQLCTKPGFAFVPTGAAGDALVAGLAQRATETSPAPLLSEGIRDNFTEGVEHYLRSGAVIAARGDDSSIGEGFAVRPTLLEMDAEVLTASAVEECFGPTLVVVRYASTTQLLGALSEFPASLTLSLHSAADDEAAAREVLRLMTERVGRIVFDGFPTGVRVSWGQHHGGPWPSTNSQHTSVGATAIRRFLRPLAFQNAPGWAIPDELRDGLSSTPRRVDGRLQSGDS